MSKHRTQTIGTHLDRLITAKAEELGLSKAEVASALVVYLQDTHIAAAEH